MSLYGSFKAIGVAAHLFTRIQILNMSIHITDDHCSKFATFAEVVSRNEGQLLVNVISEFLLDFLRLGICIHELGVVLWQVP